MRTSLASITSGLASGLLVLLVFALGLSNALTSVVAALFLLAALLALLLGAWRGQMVAVLRHPVVLSSLALFGFIALSGVWSEAPWPAMQAQLLRNAPLLLVPLFALSCLAAAAGPTVWRRRCAWAFSSIMLLTLVLSFAHMAWGAWSSNPWPFPYKGEGHAIFRVHITHNVLMSLAVALWLGLALWQRHWPRWQRAALALLALLGVYNIVWMVPGRTGYLTLLAVFAALALTRLRPRHWLLAVAAVAVAGVVAVQTSASLQGRIDRTLNEVRTFETDKHTFTGKPGEVNPSDHRLAIWREALRTISRNPLAGHGVGSYRQAFCAQVVPADMCQYGAGQHPHNQVLFQTIEGGAIGAAVYLAWLATLLLLAWRQRHAGLAGYLGLAVVLVWISYGMVDTPLQLLVERLFFTLAFALLLIRPANGGAPGAVPPEAD